MKVELHFKKEEHRPLGSPEVDVTIVGDPDVVSKIMSLVKGEISKWESWKEI